MVILHTAGRYKVTHRSVHIKMRADRLQSQATAPPHYFPSKTLYTEYVKICLWSLYCKKKKKITWVNEPDGILHCLVDIWSRGKFGNE